VSNGLQRKALTNARVDEDRRKKGSLSRRKSRSESLRKNMWRSSAKNLPLKQLTSTWWGVGKSKDDGEREWHDAILSEHWGEMKLSQNIPSLIEEFRKNRRTDLRQGPRDAVEFVHFAFRESIFPMALATAEVHPLYLSLSPPKGFR
jgi:hypothetical protein